MQLSKKRIAQIKSITDDQIDYSDIPELDEEFWKNAKVVMPEPKKPVSIRINQNVLDWFKSQGKGYQTHINSVLTSYMKAHKTEG